ncbi:MAG: Glu/Leu/Phe/Val dehydrogenase dimerization domain-containing protein [Pseudomonadota bacterium]
MMNLWTESTDRLLDEMISRGIHRAYLVGKPDGSGMRASHPLFEELAQAVSADTRDYRGHQACFFEVGKESGHLLSAFVHLTKRGQAAGGLRFWCYERVEDFIRDGLRLSVGMGQKCALAGLWWGGGKGVIARKKGVDHRDSSIRKKIYQDYGRFVTGLRGCYVTAEDVGTRTEDMAWIHSTTRHTTCIPEELGGSGNPSLLTATGVVVAMEAALEFLGRGDLAGKTVALQGLGNVSSAMISDLLERKVGRIIGTDVDEVAISEVIRVYKGAPLEARQVSPDDHSILGTECDVVAPNAIGATLNPNTIPLIKAPIVCGAANNQLEDARRDAAAMHKQEVLYVPDFLANRMGIVNCANEQYGSIGDDPAIRSHLERDNPTGIFQRSMEVFRRAAKSGNTTAQEAQALADELAQQLHPMWGNRGQMIINDLVKTGWDKTPVLV